jgi:hypothetical protein
MGILGGGGYKAKTRSLTHRMNTDRKEGGTIDRNADVPDRIASKFLLFLHNKSPVLKIDGLFWTAMDDYFK